eukprot:GFYU01004936.1.p1 GENE.GFYU01004936.1~~GFYU01004936.1.p1  ORF type:complete len:138 (+),score=49.07 GFYU01004936.1:89-502(+)
MAVWGRVLAQVLTMASGVVVRAFAEAYANAAANARAGGAGAQQAAKHAAGRAGARKMSVDEAHMVLGVTTETAPENMAKIYEKMFKQNDVSRGGSFYLQSKIFHAYEVLAEDRGLPAPDVPEVTKKDDKKKPEQKAA